METEESVRQALNIVLKKIGILEQELRKHRSLARTLKRLKESWNENQDSQQPPTTSMKTE